MAPLAMPDGIRSKPSLWPKRAGCGNSGSDSSRNTNVTKGRMTRIGLEMMGQRS